MRRLQPLVGTDECERGCPDRIAGGVEGSSFVQAPFVSTDLLSTTTRYLLFVLLCAIPLAYTTPALRESPKKVPDTFNSHGLFTTIHGLAVLTFFRNENAGSVMSPYMIGALVALFLSHGVSFVRNYLIKGEYPANLLKLMASPYSRMVVMHIAVFAGGFGVMKLGSPLAGLVVLIALKTAIDARSHLREHKKARPHAFKRAQSRVNKDRASNEQEGTKMAGREALVFASKVKAYTKSKNMVISSVAIAALTDKVRAISDRAVDRAKANHRSIVKPWDL